MWTLLEWNLFSFHLEIIFSHMQFIVIIFTQKHINKLSKRKLGPKCFDFITVESFDWPKVTFYQTCILHRILLACKCFHFVWELGKIFPHMERSSLPWSYESSLELVPSLVLQLRLEAGKVLALPTATAITGFQPLANPLILPSQPAPRANSLKLGGLIRMREALQKWPGLRDNSSKYLSFLIFLSMLQIFRHLNSGPAVQEVVI